MPQLYRNRRAVSIENDALRVTVLEGGGHIAEIFDKATGVNPLWTPVWPSIEPSAFDPATHDAYGNAVDARLLAGIMGHNLCLDIFGGPSADEAAAGLTPHGEASVATYDIDRADGDLIQRAELPLAQLVVERRLTLVDRAVRIRETVESRSGTDRPIGWTQHVTLGPPFLEKGVDPVSCVGDAIEGVRDQVRKRRLPAARRRVRLAARAAGRWGDDRLAGVHRRAGLQRVHHTPDGPGAGRRVFRRLFAGIATGVRLRVGAALDFPWLGIWEENLSRPFLPWAGTSITRGMEFGVSPMPEPRRQMIDRGKLFGVPTYRWIPAKGTGVGRVLGGGADGDRRA